MGWRADKAYEDDEREEWRRYMAAQPPLRRFFIRARLVVMMLGVFALLIGGPAVMMFRDLY